MTNEKQTIQLNGKKYESAIGGCDDCDLDNDEVQEGCFQVPKLTDGQGCGVNTCWKVKQTACNPSESLI